MDISGQLRRVDETLRGEREQARRRAARRLRRVVKQSSRPDRIVQRTYGGMRAGCDSGFIHRQSPREDPARWMVNPDCRETKKYLENDSAPPALCAGADQDNKRRRRLFNEE